jgi:hypothetical protein
MYNRIVDAEDRIYLILLFVWAKSRAKSPGAPKRETLFIKGRLRRRAGLACYAAGLERVVRFFVLCGVAKSAVFYLNLVVVLVTFRSR